MFLCDRLCSLTLKKLTVLKELDRELSSVVIAVKIQVRRTPVSTVTVDSVLPADPQLQLKTHINIDSFFHLHTPWASIHIHIEDTLLLHPHFHLSSREGP